MEASTQAVTLDEIKELLTTLLVEEFDIEPELLTDSASLGELDIDSLDMVEIGQVVDQKWGVRIRASDAEGVTDFGGIIQMIHRKIEAESLNGAAGAEDKEIETESLDDGAGAEAGE
jgi:acyl carrier protein